MGGREWTPGPWRVETKSEAEALHYDGGIACLDDGELLTTVRDSIGNIVCDNAHYYPHPIDPANANLIAAAPELYDALHAVSQAIDYETISAELEAMIDAALAKARGEK